jgi:2-aminoadipate transaminase
MTDPDLFPLEEMKEITRIVVEENVKDALQYSYLTTEGYAEFRKQISNINLFIK